MKRLAKESDGKGNETRTKKERGHHCEEIRPLRPGKEKQVKVTITKRLQSAQGEKKTSSDQVSQPKKETTWALL